VSILDGWWDEAYRPEIGWAIGRGETYVDAEYQDQVEAEALYEVLERDVIPVFYDRGPDGLPRRWIARMKASTASLCHFFNTNRMVQEYAERFYLPAADRHRRLMADGIARAEALAVWRAQIGAAWPQVHVESIEGESVAELHVGETVRAQARVHLGALTPADVAVQLYLGRVDAKGEIVEAEAVSMQLVGPDGAGVYCFESPAVPCRRSGLHGYTVRVLPCHADLPTLFLPGLIVWA
jgi:starch phosphorylase